MKGDYGDGFIGFQAIQRNKCLTVAKHNTREAKTGLASSDPTKRHLNTLLCGPATADGIVNLVEDRVIAAGVAKRRRNESTLIEIVTSVSVGFAGDAMAYFNDSISWAADRFTGRENIVSAIVHADEGHLHMHILLLATIGGKLSGRDLLGDRSRLNAHRASFYTEVGAQYGISAPAVKLMGDRLAVARAMTQRAFDLDFLRACSACQPAIMAAIHRDPRPFLTLLGLDVPAKTFGQIARSAGKGPATRTAEAASDRRMVDRAAGRKALAANDGGNRNCGFAHGLLITENRQTLSCDSGFVESASISHCPGARLGREEQQGSPVQQTAPALHEYLDDVYATAWPGDSDSVQWSRGFTKEGERDHPSNCCDSVLTIIQN